ncbi:hypothetical protein TOK_2977 [Pseudonocardia sp. N23]|nr:hypothetical protein TOK_2977 [Pseudonocardia sp. N23]
MPAPGSSPWPRRARPVPRHRRGMTFLETIAWALGLAVIVVMAALPLLETFAGRSR